MRISDWSSDVCSSDLDIGQLGDRIAAARTWTYVAHQPNWLADTGEWRERTRAPEDRLSDALHERLTSRFVDRRTAVPLRDTGGRASDLITQYDADAPVAVKEDGRASWRERYQ